MPRKNDTVRRGDFTVLERDLEEAENAYEERTAASRTRDESLRAPIAPNLETWKANQRGFDYPGVDTPTERPRQAFFDAPLPGDTAQDDGIGLVNTDRSDSLAELGEEKNAALDNMAAGVEDLLSL